MNETADADHPLTVNDVQSRLNETTVARVVRPSTVAEVQEAVRRARADGLSICVAGARHSMGGQQFLANGVLVDMTGMAQILDLDDERGVVHAQAGIEWAALVPDLIDLQQGRSRQWGIIQKQTGADRLTLGGALGSNVHGRGLTLRPIIADVEWFDIVGPDGELRRVTRDDDPELFRLAIGGYGLFGIMTSVGLRLAPRRKVQRIVELIDVDQLAEGSTTGFATAISMEIASSPSTPRRTTSCNSGSSPAIVRSTRNSDPARPARPDDRGLGQAAT